MYCVITSKDSKDRTLRLHPDQHVLLLKHIIFAMFTPGSHNTQGFQAPKMETFGNTAGPILVWKHWGCVLAWMDRNWDSWKRWHRHFCSLPDWVSVMIPFSNSLCFYHFLDVYKHQPRLPVVNAAQITICKEAIYCRVDNLLSVYSSMRMPSVHEWSCDTCFQAG